MILTLGRRTARQHRGSSLDSLALPHLDPPFGAQVDVHARTELDQADALAGGDVIAGLDAADDAPREQAGDLREGDAHAIARFHGESVALVGVRSFVAAGGHEAARP